MRRSFIMRKLIDVSTFLQPLVLTSTPKAMKSSEEASKRTVQRRTSFLKRQLKLTSGDSSATQTCALLKSFHKEERQTILKEGNLSSNYISPQDMVTLKSTLGIPWEKLKTIGR